MLTAALRSAFAVCPQAEDKPEGVVRGDAVRQVQVGQGILVKVPDVATHGTQPRHGTLLPVQPRHVQGRPVHGGVVGRQDPRPALGQVREPVAPVEAGSAQPQVQPFPRGPQDHSHGALGAPDRQPSLVHSHGDRAACGSGIRPGATAYTSRHSVAAPTPQPSRSRIRTSPRKLTRYTYRDVTSFRKAWSRWKAVTPGARGETRPRHTCHCQRCTCSRPRTTRSRA